MCNFHVTQLGCIYFTSNDAVTVLYFFHTMIANLAESFEVHYTDIIRLFLSAQKGFLLKMHFSSCGWL